MSEEGVIPQSPGGTDPAATPDPAGEPGSQRTVDNLHGEFSRKYSQLSEKFDSLMSGIDEIKKGLASTAPKPQPQVAAPGPVSPFGAPRGGLSDFSDEHIESYLQSPTLTPYQRQLLETEKGNRNQLRLANQVWDQRQAAQQLVTEKQRAEQAAMSAFPALRDQTSEFSQKVKQQLQERRQRFGEFPTDVYDVANNVAREMGVGEARAITPGSFVAPGFQERVPDRAQKPRKHELTDTDIDRIGSRLAEALPSDRQADGRMKRRTFDKKRVKDRSKMYADNADLYKHTRLGGDE